MVYPQTRLKLALHRTAVYVGLALLSTCTPNRARLDALQNAPTDVIFSAEQTSEIFHRLGRCDGTPFGNLSGTWTPSWAEFSLLKNRIHDLFEAKRPGTPLAFRDYSFQVFGINVADRRVIYFNALHTSLLTQMTRDPDREWRTIPIVVCDAGIGAFQIDYDVASAEFSEIRFSSTYGGSVQP